MTEQVAGTGREIQRGAFAVMHYRGWLFDPAAADGKGKLFIDSRENGQTLTYVYGYERAIKGLERGLEGMKVGAHRTIVVPPKLAYDDLKYPYPPDVPIGSALIFEVDLIDVVPQSAPPDQ
ncbi:MAG: FKBP-type peptidyl-prolyl cis-trans isomerase [Betaproteobacteria bacterium]